MRACWLDEHLRDFRLTDAADTKPHAPFADAVARHLHLRGDRPIGETLGAGQHDARPQGHTLRRGRSPGPLLQRVAFLVFQDDRFGVASSRHTA